MSGILTTIQNLAGDFKDKGQNVIDSLFPPEKRAEMLARLQSFAINNPKLAAFLLTNFALTGFPLVMFGVFTVTVFVFSLVAALLVGLLAALLFTAFMVGVALLVILPTVFITTMGASFLFLWGLGGYYIVKWFNQGGDSPAAEGTAIGDKLNSLTGGRMSFLMDGVRKREGQDQGEKHANGQTGKRPPKLAEKKVEKKGSTDSVQQGVSDVTKNADIGNVKDQVGKTTDVNGVKKRTSNVTNTAQGAVGGAKGAVGGATGLV
ncbi:uncharacterized protein K452DRAFT_269559 [Aplosporella prunicola CBS 121167]|uniref:Uncharacterized protein n=1 Tax=Aplosporella prunicola CBS 121167 TaxID=1176127 RepID=A0A6A6BFX2_9PEZI|nr:uncharacterized protein K452DRAFT_269559 [Aplosporella prunicola CBS 121167]KAF2142956.1 hypothetical protein K452DRAFT_269559 [Aplosporella prunicola CBS 121167]